MLDYWSDFLGSVHKKKRKKSHISVSKYDPEYYGIEEEGDIQGKSEIIIAKHRNGSTDVVQMKFKASEARFVDINDGDFFESSDGSSMQYQSSMNSFDDSEYNNDF